MAWAALELFIPRPPPGPSKAGTLTSRVFGQKPPAKEGLSFVQISDSQIGFNKTRKTRSNSTLQAAIEEDQRSRKSTRLILNKNTHPSPDILSPNPPRSHHTSPSLSPTGDLTQGARSCGIRVI